MSERDCLCKCPCNDQIVVKQYADKTVISKYPDMSKVKPSKLQKNNRSLFKEAVAYAIGVNKNPKRKKLYSEKVAPGQSVYHYALREYLANSKKKSVL
jgi:hypothetical protein